MWTKFNDYPVARSTLGDILVEAGEHLTSNYLKQLENGDEIVYRIILQNIALIVLRRSLQKTSSLYGYDGDTRHVNSINY